MCSFRCTIHRDKNDFLSLRRLCVSFSVSTGNFINAARQDRGLLLEDVSQLLGNTVISMFLPNLRPQSKKSLQ